MHRRGVLVLPSHLNRKAKCLGRMRPGLRRAQGHLQEISFPCLQRAAPWTRPSPSRGQNRANFSPVAQWVSAKPPHALRERGNSFKLGSNGVSLFFCLFFFFWLLFCTLLRGRRTPPPAPSALLLRRAEGCNFHGRNRDSPVPPPSSYRREKRSWARVTHAAGAEEEDAQHSPTAGAGCCREPGRAAPRCPPGGEGLQSPPALHKELRKNNNKK